MSYIEGSSRKQALLFPEIIDEYVTEDNLVRFIDAFVDGLSLEEWGGHMLVDCDDPVVVHKVCSTFPAFEFQARPVVAVEDAVRVELEAIAWRDGLKGK